MFTVYTDQAQGTAFAFFPTDDRGTWLATNPHVVEDVLGADRMVRLVQGKRSWRGEVATWQDQPDVALIRVAGELPTLSVAAEPTVGDQVLAYGSPFELPDRPDAAGIAMFSSPHGPVRPGCSSASSAQPKRPANARRTLTSGRRGTGVASQHALSGI